MHPICLWGFLVISCLAVTTVLCQDEDVDENCFERIEECKKVAFDEEDELKRSQEQTRCFSSFRCKPGEDSKREELKKRASARAEAFWSRRSGFQRRKSESIAPANKITFQFMAACLVAVLCVTHC
ncbi:unnamed protein product [Lymnaea stagnalis]|uniref:Secreted protein n=1 Tax=Lymnaea stagnalis TaxID=6523 RepID=A0AAV2H5Q7_LYMST